MKCTATMPALTMTEAEMGFFDKAKEAAEQAAVKAREVGAELGEKAGPAWEKTKQEAADLGEKARPVWEKTKQEATGLADKAKNKLQK